MMMKEFKDNSSEFRPVKVSNLLRSVLKMMMKEEFKYMTFETEPLTVQRLPSAELYINPLNGHQLASDSPGQLAIGGWGLVLKCLLRKYFEH